MFQLNIASVGGKGGKIKKTKNPLQIEIFTSFNCILLVSVDPKKKPASDRIFLCILGFRV